MRRGPLLAVLVAIVAAPVPASADITKTLPVEDVLRIKARVGDDAAFTGTLTLDSADKVPAVTFRSTDLVSLNGERIRAGLITLVGDSKFDLPGNSPRDLDGKVAGIKMPGVYKGTLYFLVPSQKAADGFALSIEVTALSVPKLTLRKGSEAIKLQLVNCAWFGCMFARWLEPGVGIPVIEAGLDNPTPDPFTASVNLSASGDVHRDSLHGVVSAPAMLNVVPNPIFQLPITIDRSPERPPVPDHYVGDVQLRADVPEPLVRIPLEVNVRSGPMLPMFVIFLGILLGRVLKFMNERGNAQADLLSSFYRLEAEAATSPADRQLLDSAFADVRARIYDMRLEQAKTELATVDARWQQLRTWRGIERTLEPRRGEAAVDNILRDIERGRGHIRARSDEDAREVSRQVDAAFKGLGAPPLAYMPRAPSPAYPGPVPVPLPRYQRWLARLAGIRAELTLWFVRPLLYVLLLASLVVVGLMQLYVKNLTFGSDPVGDYFGLLVWGMSADVAGRTLASLKS